MILYYWLIAIIPLSDHPLWSGFVGDLTVTKYIGLASMAYAIIHMLLRGSIPKFFSLWQARMFLLYFAIAIVSYITLGNSLLPWNLGPLFSLTSFFVLMFISTAVVDSITKLRYTVLVVLGSVSFASLYVLREWQVFHNVYRNFRPGFVVGDANYFSASVVLCLPFGVALLFQHASRFERFFAFGCTCVTLLAFMLASSRGGFMGLVAAGLFLGWRSRYRWRMLVLVVVALGILSVVIPSSPLHRLISPDYSDAEAVDNRLVAWRAGWAMVQDHPLVGVGLGNFKSSMRQYRGVNDSIESIAHNTYLEVAAELGIPTLLIFLTIIGLSFRTLRKIYENSPDPVLAQGAVAVKAGLIGFCVDAATISAEYQKLFWLLLFLTIPMYALFQSSQESADEPATKVDTDSLVPVYPTVKA